MSNPYGNYSSDVNISTSPGLGYSYFAFPLNVTSGSSFTITVADMLDKIIYSTDASSSTFTTDSAANIISALTVNSPNYSSAVTVPANVVKTLPPIGTTFEFTIINNGAGTITMAAGSNVTLNLASTTIAANTVKRFMVYVNSATTVYLYG